jgi:hypothetical protein
MRAAFDQSACIDVLIENAALAHEHSHKRIVIGFFVS